MRYLLLAAFIAFGDQWLKAWTLQNISRGATRDFIPGLLGLTYVQNTGASWGIFSGQAKLLLLLTVLLCGVMFVMLLLGWPRSGLGRLALGMVLGGAVGNALDRLFLNFVVDMFETLFIRFPVFNLADCFITVGGALFCLSILLEERREHLSRRQAGTTDNAGTDGGD